MENIEIRPISEGDKTWIATFLKKQWGSHIIISRGKKHDASNLPGFIAIENDKPVGLISYEMKDNECEIVTLNSLIGGKCIGTKLVEAVKKFAKVANCKRLWLIETNDNMHALRFYQKIGFHLVAVHPNAIELSRKMKPEIPLIGNSGIPIRDELELEILL
jgi:N-acetylglutamate synthase-like GNAT family acetyltransferase